METKRRKWAYLYMPVFFLVFGYTLISIVFAPVIQFVTSSVDLILLNDAPNFDNKKINLFAEAQKDKNNENKETIASSELEYPGIGTEYGRVLIEKLGVDVPLTFGDRPEDIRAGVGQYNGSKLPGEVGTSLIGGHNTDALGKLDLLNENDIVEIKTHYGTYNYTVKSKRVARFDDPDILGNLFNSKKDDLILYTCYPLDMIGLTDDRLYVFADRQSGPIIDEEK